MDYDKLSKPKDKQAKKDTSKPAATLSLNVYTETLDPRHISCAELKDAQVGHSWISLKFNDPKSAPASLGLQNPTRTLVEKEGETSMGFWPLIHSPEAFIQDREDYYTTDKERK